MKKYEEVSKTFYEDQGVVRYLQLEDMASKLRELVRDDATTYLYKHTAIKAEKWRLEHEPDREFTVDLIYEYSVDIADQLMEDKQDMVTMFLWLETTSYDSSDVRDFVYENAEDIVKAHHELFDD